MEFYQYFLDNLENYLLFYIIILFLAGTLELVIFLNRVMAEVGQVLSLVLIPNSADISSWNYF